MLVHIPNFYPAIKRMRLPNIWKTNLDHYGEVAVGRFYGDSIWICTNKTGWHIDEDFPPHSALLVVRNTGVSVHVWSHGSVVPNAGDLIMLNVHKRHKAESVKKNGRLLCLVHDFHQPVTPEEVRREIQNTLTTFRRQVPKEVEY